MKKIKTNYPPIKIINSRLYGTIDNNQNQENFKYLTEQEIKEGYIFAPYIISDHTEDSLKEYNDFMEIYNKEHECCPKCKSKEHTTTLVGYVLNWNKKEEYKDMNICECTECGDKHYMHDRIPLI